MNRLEKIRRQLVVNDATMIQLEDQRYSSTHVSANVTSGDRGRANTNVTSSVSHHQVQKIWFKSDKEEWSHTISDRNISALAGHRMRCVYSAFTGKLLLLANQSTEDWWIMPVRINVNSRTVDIRAPGESYAGIVMLGILKPLWIFIPLLYCLGAFLQMILAIKSVLFFPTLSFRERFLRQRAGFDIVWPGKNATFLLSALLLLASLWLFQTFLTSDFAAAFGFAKYRVSFLQPPLDWWATLVLV